MYLEIILGISASYFFLFLLSLILKDNSIVDIFCGIGILQITLHSIYLSKSFVLSQIILLIIIIFWSIRLSYHILSKRIKRDTEDSRYLQWRKEWKYFYLRSFLQIYILQGLLMIFVSIAIIFFNLNPPSVSIIFIIGLLISILGLIFESIADYQLKSFLSYKKNKGKIIQKGLWQYSRHPNYFGESVFWLGISFMAVQSSIFAFVSYFIITFLLRFVSGVPMAEKNYLSRNDFKIYAKKTPAFIPNFLIK